MYHESIQTEEAETEFAEAEAALAEMTEAYQSGEEMYSQLKSLTDTYMCWRTYFAEEPEEEGMSALEREVLIPLTKVLIRLPDEAKKRQILAGFTSFMKGGDKTALEARRAAARGYSSQGRSRQRRSAQGRVENRIPEGEKAPGIGTCILQGRMEQ